MIVREWLKKLMDTSERDVKRLMPIVQKINALEPDFQVLSNEQLRAKTDEFRKRLQTAHAGRHPARSVRSVS
jgi:protein translocase subunit secA